MKRIVVLLALAGCVDRRAAPLVEPYVIEGDNGGQVISAVADRQRLEAWGGAVEIRGQCASACVIFATLPNACIAPDAVLQFHGAYVAGTDIMLPADVLAPYMRGEVRRRYEQDWSRTKAFVDVPARDYIRLDPEARLCAR